jgi:hypothetical protein
MALSAFFDKELPPTDRRVASTLGATAPLWESVQAKILEHVPAARTSWGFTNKATGWSLRVALGDRVLVYLTPTDGCFLASLALSERAVAAARAAKLPKSMAAVIENAPAYAEGRGVRFMVKTSSDVTMVVKLTTFNVEP